jgi:hypothetical protein
MSFGWHSANSKAHRAKELTLALTQTSRANRRSASVADRSDNHLRGMGRNSLTVVPQLHRTSLLRDGELAEVSADLLIFNKRHRQWVIVSSSNFASYQINPNTGQDFSGFPDAEKECVRVRIRHTKRRRELQRTPGSEWPGPRERVRATSLWTQDHSQRSDNRGDDICHDSDYL